MARQETSQVACLAMLAASAEKATDDEDEVFPGSFCSQGPSC